MVKITILFGACSSFGSGGLNVQPPKGDELFVKLVNDYPDTWGRTPSKYEPLFQDNFERGMDAIYGEYSELSRMLINGGKYV